MSDFLIGELLWGVAGWRLLTATLIIFLGFGSRRIILGVLKSYLKRKAVKTAAQWDDELVEYIPAPFAVVIQILLWYVAAILLSLPGKPVDVKSIINQGLVVALAVAITWMLMRTVDVIFSAWSRAATKTESRLDDQLIPLFRKTIKLIVAIITGIMIINNLGYSVTSMLAGIGVGGLALALAAKDTVANLFGSVVVFADQPFQVGDWIQFSGIEGTVEEVGFRTTRIRRFDKSQVIVPNAIFSSNAIVNHSRRPIRRIKLVVGVTYETSAEKMRLLLTAIRNLIKKHPAIDQGFHFVNFTDLAESSFSILIYCFSKSTVWTEYLDTKEDLMLTIMAIVEEHGLEMAFPTRTVYLRDEHWPEPPEPSNNR